MGNMWENMVKYGEYMGNMWENMIKYGEYGKYLRNFGGWLRSPAPVENDGKQPIISRVSTILLVVQDWATIHSMLNLWIVKEIRLPTMLNHVKPMANRWIFWTVAPAPHSWYSWHHLCLHLHPRSDWSPCQICWFLGGFVFEVLGSFSWGPLSKKTRWSPRTRMLTRMLMVQMSKHMVMQSRTIPFCNSLFEQSCTCFPCYQSAVWSGKCGVWSKECGV